MKKIFTLLLALALLTNLSAQVGGYTFSQSTGTFTEITGGTVGLSYTVPSTAPLDDQVTSLINFPFAFSYAGKSFTQYSIAANGYMQLGVATASTTSPLSSNKNCISACGENLYGGRVCVVTASASSPSLTVTSGVTTGLNVGDPISDIGSSPKFLPTTILSTTSTAITLSANATAAGTARSAAVHTGVVRYETSGTLPNRVLTIQWKNFRQQGSATVGDRWNFQIKMYETTNVVEFVYGEMTYGGSGVWTGADVGLTGASTTDFNNRRTTSTSPNNVWNNTLAGTANTSSNNLALAAVATLPSGLTYTFTPPSCFPPFRYALGATTATSATVKWEAPVGTPTDYDVEWKTSAAAFDGTTNIVAVGSAALSATISGLTANTAYKARIRSVCSGTPSLWSLISIAFSTASTPTDISSVAYNTSFEGTTALPTGWNFAKQSDSNSVHTVRSASTSSPSVNKYAGINYFEYNFGSSSCLPNQQDRYVLPAFATTGMTTVEMSLAAFEDYETSELNNKYTLQYSLDQGETWSDIANIIKAPIFTSASSSRWVKRYYTFPANAAGVTDLRVAIITTRGLGILTNKGYLDDITVGGIATVQNADANTCNVAAFPPTNTPSTAATPATNQTVAGQNWFRFFQGSNVIAEINPNGNDLGLVAIKYLENTAGSANVPSVSGAKLLPRNISIKPTTIPTTPVSVRLYFADEELADYNTAAGLAKTISQLGISKKTVASEDCDPTNNGTSGGTSITPTAVDYGTGFYLEFTTTTFSEFAATEPSVVLAAELTNFTAKKSGDYNQIAWTTASEKNVSNFSVERLIDGQNNWTSIGTVKAIGTSNAEQTYNFSDVAPTIVAYYRLVTTDNDGKAATSKTVSVIRSVKYLTVKSIAPNPVTEGSSIEVLVNKTSNVSVVVTDVLGKVVKTQTFSVSEGINTMPLNLSTVAQGTYIVTINDGETSVTKRIVKQ